MIRLLLFVLLFATPAIAGDQIRDDLTMNFAGAKAAGSFVLYDPAKDQWIYVNKAQATTGYIPASTFQVPLALIGLESGALSGPDHVIKWDGEEHKYKQWNKDHSLKTAIKRSVVWYFQAVAKQYSPDEIGGLVKGLAYGNMDVSGDADSFWLDGNLRISAQQQVEFLKKLFDGPLTIQEKNIQAVRSMLHLKETPDFRLYGKGGFGSRLSPSVAWQIGWVETGGKTYFFALNLVADVPSREMATQRLPITMKMLKDLKIID